MSVLHLEEESKFWQNSRIIIHLIGICGAGKSTICKRLTARIGRHHAVAISTIDYDPRIPDHQCTSKRAFSRELDRRNIETNFLDSAVHRDIVTHTRNLLETWMTSDANVVIVDRWYESYDNLPEEYIIRIENSIKNSGFNVYHCFLVIADSNDDNDARLIRERLLHTKETRPISWWMTSIEDFVCAEHAAQKSYRSFVKRSEFHSTTLRTVAMDWQKYENQIVRSIMTSKSRLVPPQA